MKNDIRFVGFDVHAASIAVAVAEGNGAEPAGVVRSLPRPNERYLAIVEAAHRHPVGMATMIDATVRIAAEPRQLHFGDSSARYSEENVVPYTSAIYEQLRVVLPTFLLTRWNVTTAIIARDTARPLVAGLYTRRCSVIIPV